MSEGEFRALRDLIREEFGIFYDDGKQFLLQSRLAVRLAKAGLQSYNDYYALLRSPVARGAELRELASVLTNNETYFFREQAQLKALSASVLEELLKERRARPLRIWSAACSSGEEPYSLAMTLTESPRLAGVPFEIHASDISDRVLARAQSGVYQSLSFRATEPAMLQRHFEPAGPNEHRLREEIKRQVRFFRLNLMDEQAMAIVPEMDAIFCRNVLIYFDRPTQKRVVESFAKRLSPRGFLFLGHAESLFHVTDLYEPMLLPDTIVYRRKPSPEPREARAWYAAPGTRA
ncbi:MAG TPA: protein-glutamate O-methyltransferase CheR [Candidatus Dormibacteraeota bacterium]|nr:protein-glutamate O-methyltransferase CheR [Candidatus Dormibacteraeota bacterium]